jgi:hypothetical protein
LELAELALLGEAFEGAVDGVGVEDRGDGHLDLGFRVSGFGFRVSG